MKNKLIQYWNSLSPETQYEVQSGARTFVSAFLMSLAVQANSVDDLSRSVILGILTTALRTASKSLWATQTKNRV